ncbi:MAG: NUDIX hydrolase [Deltaproteobacteria bacterium]|nr:NUDIX hydrolase [Deltaproteobacteria bacterium]
MTVATVHSRRHLHQTRVLDVGVEDVTLPSGVRTTLDVLKHPGASCVLPIDVVDGVEGVTLIRQFRHCADGWLWEAPAGTLNKGETPEECARREVVEEAGLAAGRLEHVGFIFTAPGFTDEKIHLYLAHECTAAPVHRDDDEVITEIKRFTWPEVLAMLGRNELQDGKTLAVLMHAHCLRLRA